MKKLSVIIPVYNEEKTIELVLQRVSGQEISGWEKEVIVVDDGSTDATASEISSTKFQIPNLKIIRHERNQGKGAAVRTGIAAATGDAVIIQDADLEYDPQDWPQLLFALENDPGVVAVFGSRELQKNHRSYFSYVLGVRLLNFMVNFLFATTLTDVYTGYKLFRTDFLKALPLESRGFEIEAELTCRVLKRGGRIKEVAISYSPRSFQEGKKIRGVDGLRGLWTILGVYLSA